MKIIKLIEQEYNNIPIILCVSFIYGILFYFSLTFEPNIYFCTLLLVISIILTLLLKNFAIKLILFFVFGIFVATLRTYTVDFRPINEPFIANVVGEVRYIKPTIYGVQLTLGNVEFDGGDRQSFFVRVTTNFFSLDDLDVEIGDKISFNAQLLPPSEPLLPGGYNFKRNAFYNNIGAVCYMYNIRDILLTKKLVTDNTIFDIKNLRYKIYNKVIEALGQENGNFATAILLGETGAISKNIIDNMRHAGISHILCISGLHLSLVAMIFFVATRFAMNLFDIIALKYDIKKYAACFSVLGAFGYLLLTSMQIAATRAFLMTAIFISSIIVDRTSYPLRAITIAAFVMLTFNPEYVVHPSFQLSFFAVLSLIVAFDFLSKHKGILPLSYNFIGKSLFYITSNMYSTIVVTLATAPVIMYHFYNFATYAVLSNLIAIPVMTAIIMPFGIISVILMPLHLEQYSLYIMSYGIDILKKLSAFIVDLPYAFLITGHITDAAIAIFVFGFFILVSLSTKLRLFSIPILVISIVMILTTDKPAYIINFNKNVLGIKNNNNELEIYGKYTSAFVKEYWSNWFGQKDIIFSQENIHNKSINLNDYNLTLSMRNRSIVDNIQHITYLFDKNESLLIWKNAENYNFVRSKCNRPFC